MQWYEAEVAKVYARSEQEKDVARDALEGQM
jgi:hypothetical protein